VAATRGTVRARRSSETSVVHEGTDATAAGTDRSSGALPHPAAQAARPIRSHLTT
jgi:hypothetical protein